MKADSVIPIEQAIVLLTVDQIVNAVRQLDAGGREKILQALRQTSPLEPGDDQLAIAALNSPAAAAVWDNPADAAAYDAIPWEPGDVLSAR